MTFTTTASGIEGRSIGMLPGPNEQSAVRSEVHPDVIYEQISTGVPCWITDSTGTHSRLHIDRWLGGDASTPDDRLADETMLDHCWGPTLDVGCGPGRLIAALNDRGVPVLGVDISALAVEMTLQRGGDAICRDVFAPLPGSGKWAHVLLADGNIGIGGDPLRMLARARELLAPEGTVIAELDPRVEGVQQLEVRWETVLNVGRWFSWARVGIGAAGQVARQVGLRLVDKVHVAHRSFAVMERADGV
jgi:SAM-dependent methyltransferase